MALEEGRPVMFRVVPGLVPGLFYVKSLERKNVPQFHVFFARTHIDGLGRSPPLCVNQDDMEHVEHVEQKLFSITYRDPCLSKT